MAGWFSGSFRFSGLNVVGGCAGGLVSTLGVVAAVFPADLGPVWGWCNIALCGCVICLGIGFG